MDTLCACWHYTFGLSRQAPIKKLGAGRKQVVCSGVKPFVPWPNTPPHLPRRNLLSGDPDVWNAADSGSAEVPSMDTRKGPYLLLLPVIIFRVSFLACPQGSSAHVYLSAF